MTFHDTRISQREAQIVSYSGWGLEFDHVESERMFLAKLPPVDGSNNGVAEY